VTWEVELDCLSLVLLTFDGLFSLQGQNVEEIFTVLANRMPQPVETTLPNAVSCQKRFPGSFKSNYL
jgi:hypothetical protein